jgi:hypothetical protein
VVAGDEATGEEQRASGFGLWWEEDNVLLIEVGEELGVH